VVVPRRQRPVKKRGEKKKNKEMHAEAGVDIVLGKVNATLL